MQIIVYVEETADGYRARPFTPADFVGTGPTVAEAIQKLQERFGAGRIAVIDVPTVDPFPDPTPPVGFDGPGFAKDMAYIHLARQEIEAAELERDRIAEQASGANGHPVSAEPAPPAVQP